MKKLMSNRVVCIGRFCVPDIEEGTFHDPESGTDVGHQGRTQTKCPCPPPSSQEVLEDTEDNQSDD